MKISTTQFPLSIPDNEAGSDDIALLQQIAGMVEMVALRIDPATCAPPPYVVRHATDEGYVRRIVLYHRPEYLLHRSCAFVGFLGKKRPLLSAALVHDMVAADEHLMDELVGHADLLSYASLELADRNWCNLVVFRHAEAVEVIHQQDAHRHASRELAPQYYSWIRLYHGTFPVGLSRSASDLAVTKSQQFTFMAREQSVSA